MAILRTQTEQSSYKKEKQYDVQKEKYNKEQAAKLDKEFSSSSFSSVADAEAYYNSIPNEIRSQMTINPSSIKSSELSKYEKEIQNLEEDIKSYKEKEKKYKKKGDSDKAAKYDAKQDEYRERLKTVKEYYNKVKNEGKFYNLSEVKSLAKQKGKQEYQEELEDNYNKLVKQAEEQEEEEKKIQKGYELYKSGKATNQELLDAGYSLSEIGKIGEEAMKSTESGTKQLIALKKSISGTSPEREAEISALEKSLEQFQSTTTTPTANVSEFQFKEGILTSPTATIEQNKAYGLLTDSQPSLISEQATSEQKSALDLLTKGPISSLSESDLTGSLTLKGLDEEIQTTSTKNIPTINLDVISNKNFDIPSSKKVETDQRTLALMSFAKNTPNIYKEYKEGKRELKTKDIQELTDTGTRTNTQYTLELTKEEKAKREKEQEKASKQLQNIKLDTEATKLYNQKIANIESVGDIDLTKYDKEQLKSLADFERLTDLQSELNKDIEEYNKLNAVEQNSKLAKELNTRQESITTRLRMNPYVKEDNGLYKFSAPQSTSDVGVTFEGASSGIDPTKKIEGDSNFVKSFKASLEGQKVLDKETGKQTFASKLGEVAGKGSAVAGGLTGGLLEAGTTEIGTGLGLSEEEAKTIGSAVGFAGGMALGGGLLGKGAKTLTATKTAGKVASTASKIAAVSPKTVAAGKTIGKGIGYGLGALAVGDVLKEGAVKGTEYYEKSDSGSVLKDILEGAKGATIYGGSKALKTGSEFYAFGKVLEGAQQGRQVAKVKGLKEDISSLESGKGVELSYSDISSNIQTSDITPGKVVSDIQFSGVGKSTKIISKEIPFKGTGRDISIQTELSPEIKTPITKGEGEIKAVVGKGKKAQELKFETQTEAQKMPDESILAKTVTYQKGVSEPTITYGKTSKISETKAADIVGPKEVKPLQQSLYKTQEITFEAPTKKILSASESRTIQLEPTVKETLEVTGPSGTKQYKILESKAETVKAEAKTPETVSTKVEGPEIKMQDIGTDLLTKAEVSPTTTLATKAESISPLKTTTTEPSISTTGQVSNLQTELTTSPIKTPTAIESTLKETVGKQLAEPLKAELESYSFGNSGVKTSSNIVSQMQKGFYLTPSTELNADSKIRNILNFKQKLILEPKEQVITSQETTQELDTSNKLLKALGLETGLKTDVATDIAQETITETKTDTVQKVLETQLTDFNYTFPGFTATGVSVPTGGGGAAGAPRFSGGMSRFKTPTSLKKGVKINPIKSISKNLNKYLFK